MERFWSHDPDDGFQFWETREEAMKACAVALGEDREIAAYDGWPEDMDNICWGLVEERVGRISHEPAENADEDEYEDFALLPVEDADEAVRVDLMEATRGAVDEALRDYRAGMFDGPTTRIRLVSLMRLLNNYKHGGEAWNVVNNAATALANERLKLMG